MDNINYKIFIDDCIRLFSRQNDSIRKKKEKEETRGTPSAHH